MVAKWLWSRLRVLTVCRALVPLKTFRISRLMHVESVEAQIPPVGVLFKTTLVVVVSFPKRRNESCQSLRQFGLPYDRWRHRLPPSPKFRHELEGREIFSCPLHLWFLQRPTVKGVQPYWSLKMGKSSPYDGWKEAVKYRLVTYISRHNAFGFLLVGISENIVCQS
ncbi:hypothetical protein TNCV_2868041 [Trichonephila clavipes]|nr:hypothetical protein TNCV_2868041 [Trichonephila clavipes]